MYVKLEKIIVLVLLIRTSSYIQYINKPMHSTKYNIIEIIKYNS